jgi:single-strand DNA-binding protein
VVAWRTLAEQCGEELARGRRVYVEERLQTCSWDDAATSQKRCRTEVVAERMVLLDSRSDRAGAHDAADAGDAAELEAVAPPA